tara:strand:- start:470 stop:961 length:492 start_codon:yes stop_codon:yes gene_type:complete
MSHIHTKRLFIVKNITSTEVDSVGVFRQDATIEGELYSLIKSNNHDDPEGELVSSLTLEQFAANLDSFSFGGNNGVRFRKEELRFSEEIATAFSSAQSALSVSDGNILFDELSKTSHRISRGQNSLAWYEFNLITNPIVTQDMKDFLNGMFLNHFNEMPRDLS